MSHPDRDLYDACERISALTAESLEHSEGELDHEENDRAHRRMEAAVDRRDAGRSFGESGPSGYDVVAAVESGMSRVAAASAACHRPSPQQRLRQGYTELKSIITTKWIDGSMFTTHLMEGDRVVAQGRSCTIVSGVPGGPFVVHFDGESEPCRVDFSEFEPASLTPYFTPRE